MKNLTIDNQEIYLELANVQVLTTSLQIAEIFGKRHGDILTKIRDLPTDDFNRRNFSSVEYTDTKGEPRPYYLISRDGLSSQIESLLISLNQRSNNANKTYPN